MNYVEEETRDEFLNDLCSGGRQHPATRRGFGFILVLISPFNAWLLIALCRGKVTDSLTAKIIIIVNLTLYATLTLFYLLDGKFQFLWKRRLQASKKKRN